MTTPVSSPPKARTYFVLGKPHPSSLKFMFPQIAAILRRAGYR